MNIKTSPVRPQVDTHNLGNINSVSNFRWLEFFGSEEFTQARRRVFRQLIQALLFEHSINFEEEYNGEHICFKIQGMSADGVHVIYQCEGMRRYSFGRIQLNEKPVLRSTARDDAVEVTSISQFLHEIQRSFLIEMEFIERFIHELEQTQINDASALYFQRTLQRCMRDMDYDDIESNLATAHPYHPCYKSRIGFSHVDNQQFCPEFLPYINLFWLAVRKKYCLAVISNSCQQEDFWRCELGSEQVQKFREILFQCEKNPDDFTFLPVHPWQWEHKVLSGYSQDLHYRHIICLGEGNDKYRPQQSIRTLANSNEANKHYVKLALNIVNTSTDRGLAEHTIANSTTISDWLSDLVEQDSYLSDRLKTVILREVFALSYQPSCFPQATNSLACVWRESLHPFLEDDEYAMPFSALTAVDRDKRPVIEPWLHHYGVERWLDLLLRVSVMPLIHLLYGHGVALESHGQNMILIHRQGRPVRVALKDFHDGVRFMPSLGSSANSLDTLWDTPALHLENNSSSYIKASDPDDVKDFLYSAFFSMNLSEFALFFDKHYELPEKQFWGMVRSRIKRYQEIFPEQNSRYRDFDLFSDYVNVEAHTKRRLQNESVVRINRVQNPLNTHWN